MSEFEKITTLQDPSRQDEKEMLEGYRAGLRGDPEPGSDKSRAHWHGWRNGVVDQGAAEVDGEQAELARLVVAAGRTH